MPKILMMILLVFVFLCGCSSVNAMATTNPQQPEITIEIQEPVVVGSIVPPPGKGDHSVIVREGYAKNVVVQERSDWVAMTTGSFLKLKVKQGDSTSQSKTTGREFTSGWKLSYSSNLMGTSTLSAEASASLSVSESDTIAYTTEHETTSEYDLSCYPGNSYFCVVQLAGITYYTIHTWHCFSNSWTHELVGISSRVVTTPVSTGVYDVTDSKNNTRTDELGQDDSPLRRFNEDIYKRYDVIWDPSVNNYVAKLKESKNES